MTDEPTRHHTHSEPEPWTVIGEIVVIQIDGHLTRQGAITDWKQAVMDWAKGLPVDGRVAVMPMRAGRGTNIQDLREAAADSSSYTDPKKGS